MSNFKVKFTLRQHTPMIHFQAKQSGATLRASELKPRFDKFLKEFSKQSSNFRIDKEKSALKYKIAIWAKESKANDISKDELFFGMIRPKGVSQEEWEVKKKHFLSNKIIEVEFFSFNKELLEIITKAFPLFIATHNFGTRKSKGYGSFYLEASSYGYKSIEESLRELGITYYSFTTQNWKSDIALFYKFLRQGINLPKNPRDDCPKTRFYAKPAIFLFAKHKNWEWDKRAIKKHYFPKYLQKDIECRGELDTLVYSSSKQYLLRDLFGLSTSQRWMKQNANIEKMHSDIERFASPLTFKKVENRVYFWFNQSYQKILNKTFIIKVNKRGDLKLSTPSKEEFSFEEFFDFVTQINLSEVVNKRFQNEKEFKNLQRILYEIRAAR